MELVSGRRGMDLAGLPAKPVQLSTQMTIFGRLVLVVRIWQPLLWYEPGKKTVPCCSCLACIQQAWCLTCTFHAVPSASYHLPTPTRHLSCVFADRNEQNKHLQYRMGEASDYERMLGAPANFVNVYTHMLSMMDYLGFNNVIERLQRILRMLLAQCVRPASGLP